MSDFHPRDFRRSLRGAVLSATQYRVAVELSEYSGIGKAIVWPAIATLAADCGVSRSTVIRALKRLQSQGFAAPVGGRRGVGRGHTTRWQLLVKGVTSEPFYDGEKVSSETEKVSSQTIKGVTSDTRSSKEVDKEGVARASAAPPPPEIPAEEEQTEPDRYCSKHMPFGTPGNCRDCGTARTEHYAWTQTREAHRQRAAVAIRAAIDACPDCDFVGRLDNLRDCPKHPNFRKASAA